ncbi:hypothetical protein [Roseivirga sp.]|uniref:hypothetical protein n=1 Tax=Roseivirga sp. TaxID=1964215 RepID=UPI003B8B82F4
MKNYSRILVLILLLCGFSTNIKAHDPDQFSYKFIQGKSANEMTVHLTPKSAFDLILSLRQELSDTAVITLKDYVVEYSEYFNKTVSLTIEGTPVDFILYATNLTEHDATLSFQINGYKGAFDDFELSITSFTEIYHHTENHITIPTTQGELNFMLDKDKKSYTQKGSMIKSSFWSGTMKIYTMATLAVILILSLAFTYIKRQKS